jgi:hypothetical protein
MGAPGNYFLFIFGRNDGKKKKRIRKMIRRNRSCKIQFYIIIGKRKENKRKFL